MFKNKAYICILVILFECFFTNVVLFGQYDVIVRPKSKKVNKTSSKQKKLFTDYESKVAFMNHFLKLDESKQKKMIKKAKNNNQKYEAAFMRHLMMQSKATQKTMLENANYTLQYYEKQRKPFYKRLYEKLKLKIKLLYES